MKRNGRVYTVKPEDFRLPACLWNIHVNSHDHMRTIYNHNCCSPSKQRLNLKNNNREFFRVTNEVSNKPDRLKRHELSRKNKKNNNKPVNQEVLETRRLYDKIRKISNSKTTKNKKKRLKNKRRNRKQRIRENRRRNKKKGKPKIPTMATPPPAQVHETWEYTLCKLQMDAKSHKIKNGKAKHAFDSGKRSSSRLRYRKRLDAGWFFQKR